MDEHYRLAPTLEEIATKKIVLLLFNDPEIKRQAKEFGDLDPDPSFNQIVHSKILNFCLPTDLKNRLLHVACRYCMWFGQLFALHESVCSIFGFSCQCMQEIFECNFFCLNGFLSEKKIIEKIIAEEQVDAAFKLVVSVALQGETVALPYFLLMSGAMKLFVLENDMISKLRLLNIALKEMPEPLNYAELFTCWNRILSLL